MLITPHTGGKSPFYTNVLHSKKFPLNEKRSTLLFGSQQRLVVTENPPLRAFTTQNSHTHTLIHTRLCLAFCSLSQVSIACSTIRLIYEISQLSQRRIRFQQLNKLSQNLLSSRFYLENSFDNLVTWRTSYHFY